MKLLILIHTFATIFMVGLIWTIQVVHYPLFANVGEDVFRAFQYGHQWRITVIVLPVMIVELATAGLLLWRAPEKTAVWLLWFGFLLLGTIWLSTLFVQSPQHAILDRGWNAEAHRMLTNSNWFRTIGWSVRGVLSLKIVSDWMG